MPRALILIPLVAVTATFNPPRSRTAERVVPNENRTAAGAHQGDVLTLALEARGATWYPEGDTGPSVAIPAFAEVGKPTQVPGPLVRVPAGSRVTGTIRNSLPNDTLLVHGLYTRAAGATASPPLRLAPGEQRALDFRLDASGTY